MILPCLKYDDDIGKLLCLPYTSHIHVPWTSSGTWATVGEYHTPIGTTISTMANIFLRVAATNTNKTIIQGVSYGEPTTKTVDSDPEYELEIIRIFRWKILRYFVFN